MSVSTWGCMSEGGTVRSLDSLGAHLGRGDVYCPAAIVPAVTHSPQRWQSDVTTDFVVSAACVGFEFEFWSSHRAWELLPVL